MAATGEAITSQSPVTGFQPGSPERPSGSPERPSGCGVDESRVVQGGGRRTERSSVEGRAGLRALPSQPPPEHSGLATEAAPRPGGASTVPSTVPSAVLGVQGGGGGAGRGARGARGREGGTASVARGAGQAVGPDSREAWAQVGVTVRSCHRLRRQLGRRRAGQAAERRREPHTCGGPGRGQALSPRALATPRRSAKSRTPRVWCTDHTV